MTCDYYESLDDLERARQRREPPMGIGPDSVIERAIVDKNARIGRGVRIVNAAGAQHADGDGYYIREGIVVVPKGGVIRDGTVI
jgi:glucose-1-phosphate adenylyltransferase